jgi:hypothetical protein
VESAGVSRMLMLFATALGAATIFLFVINAMQLSAHRREGRGQPPTGSLAKWAWGLSVVSLVVLYLAPFTLILAVIASRRSLPEQASPARRPAKMALLNSLWGLFALLATFAVLIKTGVIRSVS